ncbi:CHAT domain-containing protein [Amylocarpus encephaloides]|uniref:CHAT domain-containing protein n=1 Tax=Amylocarpus encephaloides TaxID=45428 RepID=A0A9P7Y7Q0_9HELO|nr:CHAT domain-containing protein [Amylocarpus encephaloides]
MPPGSSVVTIHIVRPGTFAALEAELQNAKAKNQQYHLLHFDVHGKFNKVESKKKRQVMTVVPKKNRRDYLLTVKHSLKLVFANNDEKSASSITNLVKEHGVRYVVLNACESARGDEGMNANLAKMLVTAGVPHVLAMSYKLQISAVNTLLEAFYGAFLTSGFNFADSAAVARTAMRDNKIRKGRFGFELTLEDWVVPVVYSSTDYDPPIRTIKSVPPARSLGLRGLWNHDKKETAPNLQVPLGHDRSILELENMLCKNDTSEVGRVLLLSRKYDSGSSALLRFLEGWWLTTGFTLKPIHIDMQHARIKTPKELCKRILKDLPQSRLSATENPSIEDLKTLLGGQYILQSEEDCRQTKKRPLLILDNFSLLLPPKPKPADLDSFKEADLIWKCFLEELATSDAYTIMVSHNFPWYIDDTPTTQWPWDAFYIFGSPKGLPSLPKGPELRGTVNTRKDAELFELISQWGSGCPPLQNAMTSMSQVEGVNRTVQLLRTNGDLLACSAFDSTSIRRLKTYTVAADFRKQCTSLEKSMLMSFSPFQDFLPRCLESYVGDFCLGELEGTHTIRDWVLKRAPKPTVDNYWAMMKQYNLALTKSNIVVLVFSLKRCGLIQAEHALPPAQMEDVLISGLLNRSDGTKLYSIHPVFSIFLRHQAHKAGFGVLGSSDEKSKLLTTCFLDYHEVRTFDWVRVHIEGLPNYEILCESRCSRENFIAALELKLSKPELMEHDNAPIPIFLAWCLMTCNGFSSQFASTKFSPDVILQYCIQILPHLSAKVTKAIKQGRRSGQYILLALTITSYIQVNLFIMSQYLETDLKRFKRYLHQTSTLIETLPCDTSALCVLSPQTELGKMLEVLEIYKRTSDEPESCISLTILELLPGHPESNQVLADGWAKIAKAISIARKATLFYEKDEAFGFWDESSVNIETQKLLSETDDLVSLLAKNWRVFIEHMDMRTLLELWQHGFEEAERALSKKIEQSGKFDSRTGKDYADLRKALPMPPNYISTEIDKKLGIVKTSKQSFEILNEKWKENKSRNVILKTLEIDLLTEGYRIQIESAQVKIYVMVNDWRSLKEYLDIIAINERTNAPETLDTLRLKHRIWWHNVSATCALKLQDWREAYGYLQEAFRLSQYRPDDTERLCFSTLRCAFLLYNISPAGFDFQAEEVCPEIDSYWKIILYAMLLGYRSDQNIYACNGILLTLLLRASVEERPSHPTSISADTIHAIIITALGKQPMGGQVGSLPTQISETFLKTMTEQLHEAGSTSSKQNSMQAAEICLFKRQGNPDETASLKDSHSDFLRAVGRGNGRRLKWPQSLVPVLPAFERLDYRSELPFMWGVMYLKKVWMGNKFQLIREEGGLEAKDIAAYMREWHAEFRDVR